MTATDEWTIAIVDDLCSHDRTGLIELFLSGEDLTADAREYIAHLLKKKKGRLPAKFKALRALKDNMLNAVEDFRKARADWKIENPGRRFPHEECVGRIAWDCGVDENALRIKLRRGPKSGKKL